MKLKTILLMSAAAVGGLLILGALRADAAEINGGSETGSYTNAFAPLIQKRMAGEFFQYEVKPSAGSVEAAQRVLDDPKDVSLAQLDVANSVMAANPGKLIMTNKLANECLFAVSADERLSDWAKVERLATRIRIATAGTGSGSAFTLKNVMNMNPESRLAAAAGKIQYAENAKAAVEMVAAGQMDVAFFVAYPDPDSAIFKLANSKKLNFIGVAHPNMKRVRTESGEAIYTANQIAVSKGGWVSDATTLQTACTSAVILTGNPEQFAEGSADRLDQGDLVAALKNAPASAFKPAGSKWDRIFAAAKEMTGNAADDLWSAGGQLVETVADKVSN